MPKPLPKSPGGTASERALAALCNSTFLHLWTYPSLWTPEGQKNGKGDGKELCDMLIVFGDTIILMSDKDNRFDRSKDPYLMWNTWKKESLDKSMNQLWGARKWLQEKPTAVFFDKSCSDPFPFLSDDVEYKFHLVAVTRNTWQAASDFFRDSSGSFMLVSSDKYADVPTTGGPFMVVDNRTKPYVHVYDEATLSLVLGELDTLPDFIKYLADKEWAVRHGSYEIIPGEEDFLGFYLHERGPVVPNPFLRLAGKVPKDTEGISVAQGEWSAYITSGAQEARRRTNVDSYFWDKLIAGFTKPIVAGTVPNHFDAPISMHELSVRMLAAEPRHTRAAMSRAYKAKLERTPSHIRSSMVFSSHHIPRSCFILLTVPHRQNESADEYRRERLALMQHYATAAKVRFPQFDRFTIIGTEPGGVRIRSEDLMTVEIAELSREAELEIRTFMEEHKILTDISYNNALVQQALGKPMPINGSPLRARVRRPGRNEPCGCGSGIKYKKCSLPQTQGDITRVPIRRPPPMS